MKITDVTSKWIRENFNLEEESGFVPKETTEKRFPIPPRFYKDGYKVDNFIIFLQGVAEEYAREFHVCPSSVVADFFDYDELVVFGYKQVPETEKQTIARLKREVKQKIKDEEKRIEKEKRLRQQEKKEYEEFCRLKRKFEKCGQEKMEELS